MSVRGVRPHALRYLNPSYSDRWQICPRPSLQVTVRGVHPRAPLYSVNTADEDTRRAQSLSRVSPRLQRIKLILPQ